MNLTAAKRFFTYKLTSKKRIFSYIAFILMGLSYIFFVLYNRFLRVGFYFNIYEVYYLIKDYMKLIYEQKMNIYFLCYALLISIIILNLVIFWMLLLAKTTLNLKKSVISLYLYGLQFENFRELNNNLCFELSTINLFIHIYFGKYPARVVNWLDYIWIKVTKNTEKVVYRGFLIYVIIFDIITNYGNISLLFYVMPWYYIYTIIRKIFLFAKSLIKDLDYCELSENLYKKNEA